MKILVVDDEEDSRSILLKILEYAGYSVETACDGIEALVMAKRTTPDLIISDILMPEMDGFLLCHEIKADLKLKNIPFIFYSATYVDAKDEQLAMSLGASQFILKPKETVRLIEIIKEVLQECKTSESPLLEGPTEDEIVLSKMYRERVSRKLQQKTEKLQLCRSIFKNANDAIAIVNPQGFYLEQNGSHQLLFERSHEEILEKTPASYLGENIFFDILKFLSTNCVYRGELTCRTKSGRKVDIELSVFPVFDRKNEIVCYVWVNRDITARKCAEENARQKSRQMEILTRELRKLSKQLSKKEELSRKQFARVLHEQVGQDLTAIEMICADLLLETGPDKKEVRGKIEQIMVMLGAIHRSTRTLTSNLYPAILDDLGLIAAIRDLTSRCNTFKVSLDLEESVEDLPEETQLSLFRIIQEAFQNITKYASATQVVVELKKSGTFFKLSIHDNGRGFNPGAIKKTMNPGIGIALIKERSLSLGGHFDIESFPRQGTKLVLTIPILQEASCLTGKDLA